MTNKNLELLFKELYFKLLEFQNASEVDKKLYDAVLIEIQRRKLAGVI